MIYTLEELNSLNVERQLQTVGKARKLAVWINGAASRQNLIRQFCRGNNTNTKNCAGQYHKMEQHVLNDHFPFIS